MVLALRGKVSRSNWTSASDRDGWRMALDAAAHTVCRLAGEPKPCAHWVRLKTGVCVVLQLGADSEPESIGNPDFVLEENAGQTDRPEGRLERDGVAGSATAGVSPIAKPPHDLMAISGGKMMLKIQIQRAHLQGHSGIGPPVGIVVSLQRSLRTSRKRMVPFCQQVSAGGVRRLGKS